MAARQQLALLHLPAHLAAWLLRPQSLSWVRLLEVVFWPLWVSCKERWSGVECLLRETCLGKVYRKILHLVWSGLVIFLHIVAGKGEGRLHNSAGGMLADFNSSLTKEKLSLVHFIFFDSRTICIMFCCTQKSSFSQNETFISP